MTKDAAQSLGAPEAARSFFASPGVVGAYTDAVEFRRGEEYVFRTFLKAGGNLLEVGCGAGRVTFLLAPRFRSIDAFDIVPEMIEAARARLASEPASIRFSVGDATAIAAADESFDNVVFAYNGIESIPTQEQRMQALSEIYRVLKPGGRFVFSTKSLFTPLYLVEGALKPRIKQLLRRLGMSYAEQQILPLGEIVWREDNKAIRLHTSNPFRVKQLLKQTGFRVVYFNSEDRIAAGQTKESFFAHFGAWDQFFVCEKPCPASGDVSARRHAA